MKISSVVAASPSLPSFGADSVDPDYHLTLAPVTLDLSPRDRVDTVAYNGQVPGPLLRFKEGKPVIVDVTNHSDRPEVVHWHGLFLPPEVDGAVEEGTPPIAASQTVRYVFTPRPAGFRWYHTHTMAMNDLTVAQYGGLHGLLLIESANEPGRYDQELFLVLHDWKGRLLASDDGAMNPRYAVSTINGKTLGSGEPLRVRQGQRILLHVLNSSPTEVHWVAFSGHSLHIIALDGNPVPTARTVPMLRLAPAERVCAVVEMNNPGVWIFGAVRKHVQAAGMGVVVEYTGQHRSPEWLQPSDLVWNYEQFSASDAPDDASNAKTETAIPIPLVLESKFRGHGTMEAWTINGRSYPAPSDISLEQGKRYRLQLINHSPDDHPLHLHRHSFELCSLGASLDKTSNRRPKPIRGILKDVVLVESRTQVDVEFIANNPGATLFHCHQQNHMDLGFMTVFNYA